MTARGALIEKSESQTNKRKSPTLRLVEEPHHPSIYGSSPYPSKPSHVLYPGPGSPPGAGVGVSYGFDPSQRIENPGNGATSRYRPPIYEERHDGSSTQPPSTTAPLHESRDSIPMHTSTSFKTDEIGRVSKEIVHHPAIKHNPVIPKESDSSLSSSNSTGTVVVRRNRNGGKRASYSAFPSMRPSSSTSNISISNPQRPSTKDAAGDVSKVSPISPIIPSAPSSSSSAALVERRASSVPVYGNLGAADHSTPRIQYPVILSPEASASWAESPIVAPQRAQQPSERAQGRWNPHLSTVQSIRSEGSGSQSDERTNQSMWLSDSSRLSKASSSMMTNVRVSSELAPATSLIPSSNMPPLPTLPPLKHRDLTGSPTVRAVTEQDHEMPKMLSTIPASRDSQAGPTPGNNRNSITTQRGSRASFFRDSIPAWAKAYYARPNSSASLAKSRRDSRPSTSTDNISLNVFRPRARFGEIHGESLGSGSGGPSRPRELDLAESRGLPRPTTSSSWSPHLWHDRRSLGRRRTIFQAPTIDEEAEGRALSKRNAQILLFAVGFLLPPAWFIASFLPLPSRTPWPETTLIGKDLEKQLGPIDEARYENARWWRNINRILSVVGILLIAAIVS